MQPFDFDRDRKEFDERFKRHARFMIALGGFALVAGFGVLVFIGWVIIRLLAFWGV